MICCIISSVVQFQKLIDLLHTYICATELQHGGFYILLQKKKACWTADFLFFRILFFMFFFHVLSTWFIVNLCYLNIHREGDKCKGTTNHSKNLLLGEKRHTRIKKLQDFCSISLVTWPQTNHVLPAKVISQSPWSKRKPCLKDFSAPQT